jgi:hypothetical protein
METKTIIGIIYGAGVLLNIIVIVVFNINEKKKHPEYEFDPFAVIVASILSGASFLLWIMILFITLIDKVSALFRRLRS